MLADSLHAAGWLTIRPDSRDFLTQSGLTTPDAVMNLPGEIVCGHPDRHVRRVVLTAHDQNRVVYLKREHGRSRKHKLKNWLAGAGWQTRATREAEVLEALAARGLAAPIPLAWGEDGSGRGFVLIDELLAARDLPTVLAEPTPPTDRQALAEVLGEAIATLHTAGVSTPDLAAKHVYLSGGYVTLLDWQSAQLSDQPRPLTECLRALARLDATLPESQVRPRDRVRFLRSYLAKSGHAGPTPRIAKQIRQAAAQWRTRSSTRDQHTGPAPRMIWLAGEAVCVTTEAAPHWPTPPISPPFYDARGPGSETVNFGQLGPVTVTRFRTRAPIQRAVAVLREKPWRSPGTEAGRILAHLGRHGIAAPRLVGFGQLFTGPTTADSFVAHTRPPGQPLGVVFRQNQGSEAILASCRELIRQVHDAGLRLNRHHLTESAILIRPDGTPTLSSPLIARRVKRLSATDRASDWHALLQAIGIARA